MAFLAVPAPAVSEISRFPVVILSFSVSLVHLRSASLAASLPPSLSFYRRCVARQDIGPLFESAESASKVRGGGKDEAKLKEGIVGREAFQ